MIHRGTLVSRLLAAALFVAVLAAAVLLVVIPLAERWAELETRRAQAVELASRLRAIAAERETRAAELAEAHKTIAGARLYLQAESHALAGARMGEMLRELAERYGGEVRSVRVIEGGEEDRKVGRVTLNVAMRGGWAQLFPVLQAVETGDPYFFVSSFTISARGRRRARSAEEDVQTLELQIELFGYLPPEVSG